MNENKIKEKYHAFFDIPYAKYDEKLMLDIICPKKMGDNTLPAVIYIHGGGWGKGSKDQYGGHVWNLAMVDAGMIAVSINYTLKCDAIFPQQIIDVKHAISFLKKEGSYYGIDTNKIGIWGHSAGGHLAILASANHDTRWCQEVCNVQACASVSGGMNLYKLIKNGDHAAAHLFGKEIETIDEIKELVKSANPIQHIDDIMPPTMIVHGEKDICVPIEESINLQKAIPNSSFLQVKNADHFFLKGLLEMSEISKMISLFFKKQLINKDMEILNLEIYESYQPLTDHKQIDDFNERYSNLYHEYT